MNVPGKKGSKALQERLNGTISSLNEQINTNNEQIETLRASLLVTGKCEENKK